jgi:VanZ family protein
MRRWLRRVWLWGPVVLQMGLIFGASSIPDLKALPGGIPDWFGHGVGYVLLGGFSLRAFAGGRVDGVTPRAVLSAVVFATLYGVTDELHQILVPGRTPALDDLTADAVGAALAAAAGVIWRLAARPARH